MEQDVKKTEEIKKSVITHLHWDDRFDSSGIFIEVHGGEVLLTGTVPSFPARSQAMIDAYAVNGVSRVVNRLDVLPPDMLKVFEDSEIKTIMQNAMAWSPDIDPSRISVRVHEGAITLTGMVDSYWQKQRAEETAENIAGVIAVNNELQVVPLTPVDDETILKEITAAMQRSVNVDPRQVHLKVQNGVVILIGTQPDYSAVRRAEKIAAYTKGVVSITNQLTPKGAN